MRSRLKLLPVAGLLAAGALGVNAANVFGGEAGGPQDAVDRVIHVDVRPAKPGEVGGSAAKLAAKKKKKTKLTYDYLIATQPVEVAPSPSVANPSSTTAVIDCPSKFKPVSGGIATSAGTPLVEATSSHFDPATGAAAVPRRWFERVNNTSATNQTFKPTLVCLRLK